MFPEVRGDLGRVEVLARWWPEAGKDCESEQAQPDVQTHRPQADPQHAEVTALARLIIRRHIRIRDHRHDFPLTPSTDGARLLSGLDGDSIESIQISIKLCQIVGIP